MGRVKIYTIDELYKSMATHEFRKPPSMGPKLSPAEPQPEGYRQPGKRQSENPDVKKEAFSVRRKKGPEEGKRYSKRMRQEKQAERRSDIQAYGGAIEE